MKIQFLKSNNHTKILHHACIYISEYYLDIAMKENIDFSKGGKLGLEQWIEEEYKKKPKKNNYRFRLIAQKCFNSLQ